MFNFNNFRSHLKLNMKRLNNVDWKIIVQVIDKHLASLITFHIHPMIKSIRTSVLINLPTINEMFSSNKKKNFCNVLHIWKNCLYLMRCVFKGLRNKQFFSFSSGSLLMVSHLSSFYVVLSFVFIDIMRWVGVDNFYLWGRLYIS